LTPGLNALFRFLWWPNGSRLPVTQQQAFDFVSKPQRWPDADNVVGLIQDLVPRLERQLGPAKHGCHAEILEYRGVG
jgi:hypothetical protein